MKLHRLEIINLNSLYGRHVLDFEKDLQQTSLFLITGHTGAGKSTLLDAICLALFGQTPRLIGAIRQTDTDPRRIMSYGTAECHTIIEFSKLSKTGERLRYKAAWSCHRARNKASGELQRAHRSMSQIDHEGKENILASSPLSKVVEPVFTEILEGFTVEDFQRSMLLAQGEFALFLKATEDQRAAILERLTNTDIYQKIGEKVAALRKEKELSLKQMQDRIGGTYLLSAEEENILKERLQALALELSSQKEQTDLLHKKREELQQKKQLELQYAEVSQRYTLSLQKLDSLKELIEKLKEDERCLKGKQLIDLLNEQQEVMNQLQHQSNLLNTKAIEAEQNLSATEKQAEYTRQERENAERKLAENLPVIHQALNIYHMLQQEKGKLQPLQGKFQEIQLLDEQCSVELKENDLKLEALKQAYLGLEETYAALEEIGVFASEIGSWQTYVELIQEEYKSIKLVELKQEQLHQGIEKDNLNLLESKAVVEEIRLKQQEVRESSTQCQAALHLLIGDQVDFKSWKLNWQQQFKLYSRQVSLLKEAHSLARQRDTLKSSLFQYERYIETNRQELDVSINQKELLEIQEKKIRALYENILEQLDYLKLKQKLVHERSLLKEGLACPLCGSCQHPYRENSGTLDGKDGSTDQYESLKEEADLYKERLLKIDGQKGALDKSKIVLELSLIDYKSKQLEAHGKLEQIFQNTQLWIELGIDPEEKEETLQDMEHRSVQSIEQLYQQEQNASELFERMQGLEKQHSTLIERLASYEEKVERLQKECESKQKDLSFILQDQQQIKARIEQKKEDLLQKWGLYKITKAFEFSDLNYLRSHLHNLVGMANRWKSIVLEKERVEKELLVQQGAIAVLELKKENLVQQKRGVDLEISKQSSIIETLQKQTQLFFAGQNPHEVEQKLRSDLDNKNKANEFKLQQQKELQQKVLEIRAVIGERNKQLKDLQLKREEWEQELSLELERLLLSSRKELEKLLLSSEDRRSFSITRDHALSEHQAAHQLLIHMDNSLKSFLQNCGLNTQDSLEIIQLQISEWEERYTISLKEKGAIEQQLLQTRQQKEKIASLQVQYEILQKESSVWNVLYDLIGDEKGNKFKRFAQILNLQELIDKANHRLQWLAPRYTLIPARDEKGVPRMAFAVQDEYLAQAERPITTLSGGETFLVSLALALALADYRNHSLPVETLLLDEGFGTLDSHTLNIVMDALEKLQAKGTQVGIISHVELLKERVLAQIIVEKKGNGRSALRCGTSPNNSL
ncbi:MAG: hypothetical protein K0S74_1338 [Chlamydiales bacterium]|jgi:exonuclease SbcC|nr:hypothetical protein [Chlamydiales bacterium]